MASASPTMLAGFLLAALCTVRVVAQCPTDGDCRKVHETPGCVMPECCRLVCDANPLCCELGWDQACVDAAIELCDGINCPADGECLAAHATPGCSDFECCDLVSSIDGWCSGAAWDGICADLAAALCAMGRCAVDPTGAVDEAEPCFERLNDGCALGLEGPRLSPACGVAMAGKITTGGPRDTDWFALDGTARRRVRMVLEAEFPVEVQYFRGDCEGPNDVKWLHAGGVCELPIALNFLVDAGTGSLVLGSGIASYSVRRGLGCDEIDPDNPPPPDEPPPTQLFGVRWRVRFDCLAIGDIDGNGLVGAPDLAMLLDAWGAVPAGAAFDPTAPDCDLDGDGLVGAADIAALLDSW